METPIKIYYMELVKRTLDSVPLKAQDEEYKKIKDLVDMYLEKCCVHNIVEDTIDISPDSFKTIRYCLHCYKTFD